jgi:hypothetical protein
MVSIGVIYQALDIASFQKLRPSVNLWKIRGARIETRELPERMPSRETEGDQMVMITEVMQKEIRGRARGQGTVGG